MNWKAFPLKKFKSPAFDDYTENKRLEWLNNFLNELVSNYYDYYDGQISRKTIKTIIEELLKEHGEEIGNAHNVAFYRFYFSEENEEEAYNQYVDHLLYENATFARFIQNIESHIKQLLQNSEPTI